MSKIDKNAVAQLARMIGMDVNFVTDWFVRKNIARADFSYAVATQSTHAVVAAILDDKALPA